MKRTLYFAFIFLLKISLGAQVQDWSWSRSGNGTGEENSNHIAIDANGNLLVTGFFSSPTTTLGNVTLTNTGASGTREPLVAKYDASGALQWAKRGQGAGDDEGIALTSDPTGNLYVTGTYESPTITFGTITLTNSSSFTDVFVVKYDPAGNVLWAKSFGGNLLESVRSIIADNAGNTYITGSFRSLSISFGAFGVINSGNSDAYLAKMDVNGNPLWAKQIGGTQNENGINVTHDGSGNVYVMGEFNSPSLSSYTLSNAGGFDIFIGKYDASSGNLLTRSAMGGALNETGHYMVTDGSGNLYLSGSFESTSLNLGSVTLTNGSSRDMMHLKLNSSLVAQWGVRNSGNSSSNGTGIFIDQANNLYLSGIHNLASVAFGSTTLNNAATGDEGFLVKYDLSGNPLSAKSTLGTGNERMTGVVVDNFGSVYVTGSYNPTLTLGGTTLAGTGNSELFLAKLCLAPAAPTVVSSVTVCAKRTATLSATTPSGSVANWYTSATGGSPVLSSSNTLTTNLNTTFYVESFISSTGCSSSARSAISVSVQPGASVTVAGQTLTATPGTTYKWFECQKDSVVAGATAQTFTLGKTGSYAVIVTNNGCTDTSACNFYSVNITTGTITVPGDTSKTSLSETILAKASLDVYPNPSTESFSIRSDRSLELFITNLLGETIVKIKLVEDGRYISVVSGLPPGIYIISGEGVRSQRVVVTR